MWFTGGIDQVMKKVNSSGYTGLSSEEAQKRYKENGANKLNSGEQKTLLQMFFSQINDFMVYILILAAIISALVGEYSDSIIILIVVLINAIIGIFQESKAEKALEALKNLSTPKAVVKRDSKIIEIPSEQVVVGDIILIDAGRYIPADLRLIETANLKIDESAFTGESVPADKDSNKVINDSITNIGDRVNMAFMSTLATYGRGMGVVVATGMDTEIGKIAKMLEKEEEKQTPLQKRLSELGKIMGLGAVVICSLIFIISLTQKRPFMETLLTSISLAVAAIPEGLPAIVAIVLALGVQRMIKEHAIVKKLVAVETLGSVTIICSDKTGTLTQNKMTVTKYFSDNNILPIKDFNLDVQSNMLLLNCMVLCNDATYDENSKTGDPTEIALLEVGSNKNVLKTSLNNKYKRIEEIPFDSNRKLMTTVNKLEDTNRVFTKGSLDSILKISNKIFINDEVVDFSDYLKSQIMKYSDEMSDEALRVLSFAYKDITDNINPEDLEKDLTFIGLVGMIDPARPEVKASISLCKKAGITPIMITGDYKNTAIAIAKEIGIASDISEALSGSEIDSMTESEFLKKAHDIRVYARVSPEHKIKIVKALQSFGNIVSMTGDGVNDAPSLKAADIGVAMGITGTDVAKGAANMILTDDNFSTIIQAVEEGRNIYNNIKKSIIFLLSCNIGEVITLFIAILLNWDSPLLPIHILWVNLITDSFPALSLGVDQGDPKIMEEPPRKQNESIFANKAWLFLIINGTLIGGLTLFAFKYAEILYPNSLIHAQTISFVVLSISQLFLSLSMRNLKRGLFEIGIFTNKYLIGSIVFGIVVQALVISIPPIASIFKVYPLTVFDWISVILLCLIPLIITEILKLIFKYTIYKDSRTN